MADRKNFNTNLVPRGTKVFPQVVIANGFIFLSGTAGFSPATGKLISDSFEEQVVQLMPFPGGILFSVEGIAMI
ncbi:RidA family protein [Mucilaginibacter psychrotolerans]|uniref:RidA family protein n=1 Tax=Mucilaginibacter psychrotolerans TaxID=1524096 RepID=A0A4Y8S9L7_9SPHI|nr:hypothetical protein [Mucilaginibacter psychrotolerans]TFF35217.1 hypothetical protein E2R66_19830 [Mucilaginibacter psychrotolerans]